MTAAGRTAVSELRDFRFRAAGRAYSTVAAMVPRGSLREDGLVPASLFRSVYVSNSGKFLVLGAECGHGLAPGSR